MLRYQGLVIVKWLIGLYVVMTLFLTSCQGPDDHIFINDSIRNQTDSLVRSRKDLATLDSLINQFSEAGNEYGCVLTQKQIGKYYRQKGDFFKAIKHQQEGIRKAAEIGDTIELIEGMNHIGTDFRRLGILDQASVFHIKALELSGKYSRKSLPRSQKNRVISLNGLGNVFLSINDYVVADSLFRMALAGEKELGSQLGQAINYANIGTIFEHQGLMDSARYYFGRSLDCNQAIHSNVGIALCYIHFGQLYEEEKNWDAAIKEYDKAYKLMDDKVDRWHWLEACVALGRVYTNKHDWVNAEKFTNNAFEMAQHLHSSQHLAEIHHTFAQIHNQRGEFKEALADYQQYHDFTEKMLNDEKKSFITEHRIRYIKDLKQGEIDRLRTDYINERRLKRMFLYATVALVVALALVLLLFVYIIRVRERSRHQLSKAENARRSFFTNITHEFRTPLTVILGLSERLRTGKLTDGEDVKSITSIIIRQGNNLLTLVNQLLDISKVKSAIGDPDWYRGDIVPFVQMLCDNYRPAAREKHQELQFVSEQTAIEIDFVPDYLRKVIGNLVSNAVKFTPAYGKIYVSLSLQSDQLYITIADTGKGISEEDLPHIFDVYYQSENAHGELGNGVGLSLVNMIVKSVGGEISVRSALGKGAVFSIKIPIKVHTEKVRSIQEFAVNVGVGTNEITNEQFPVELPVGNDLGKEACPIVLIVEDHSDVAYFIGSELKNNYRLFYADNGKIGLDMARDILPDVIITDLMMPEMDGLTFCREVRDSDLLNHIPIIVITARCTEEDRIRGIKAGADAYLFKPFNSEELNARVENLLETRNLLREKYQRALSQGEEDGVAISDVDKKFLTKVVDVAYDLMSCGNVGCEQVADRLHMSLRQLNRKISALTGESTSSYIIRIRLSKAMRLLDAHTELSIAEIAFKCGFEDNAYFSRIFKKYFDMTPTQYRKKPKHNI